MKSIGIYNLINNELVKKANLPINTFITATDINYAYGVETTKTTPDYSSISYKYSGTALGVSFDNEYHTKSETVINNSNNIVVYTWNNENEQWYICIYRDALFNINPMDWSVLLRGNKVVISKINNLYTEYLIEGNYDVLADEYDTIWFFEAGNSNKVSIFFKTDKTIESRELPFKIVPVPHGKLSKASKYLWATRVPFDNKIYRFDKASFKYISASIPDELIVSSWKVPIYSDDYYVWVGASKHRNLPPFMNNVPYFVKLRKSNLNIQVVLAEPTSGEAIGAVFESFFNWLRSPFYMFYKT